MIKVMTDFQEETINFDALVKRNNKSTIFSDLATIIGWSLLPAMSLFFFGVIFNLLQFEVYANITISLSLIFSMYGFGKFIYYAIKNHNDLIRNTRSNFENFALINGWSYYTVPSDYINGNSNHFIPDLIRKEDNFKLGNVQFVLEGSWKDKDFRLTPIEGIKNNPTRNVVSFYTILRVSKNGTKLNETAEKLMRYDDLEYWYFVEYFTVSTKEEVSRLFSLAGLE